MGTAFGLDFFFCHDAARVGVALRAFAGELLEESEKKFFSGMGRGMCIFWDNTFLDFVCGLGGGCALASLLGALLRMLGVVRCHDRQASFFR